MAISAQVVTRVRQRSHRNDRSTSQRRAITWCKLVTATLTFIFVMACHRDLDDRSEQVGADTVRPAPKSITQWAAEITSRQRSQREAEAEAQRIAQFPDRFYRPSDSALVFTARQGTSIVLRDKWDEENQLFEKYNFIGRVPGSDALLVERATGYDTFEYLIAWESTGDTLTVDQPPLFSPSGSRFLTASACIEMSVCPVRIQIYKSEAGHFLLEQMIDTEPWGALEAEWMDETAVRFTKRELVPPDPYDLESPPYRDSDGELRLVNGRWQLSLAQR